jgi:hypothetical protein
MSMFLTLPVKGFQLRGHARFFYQVSGGALDPLTERQIKRRLAVGHTKE